MRLMNGQPRYYTFSMPLYIQLSKSEKGKKYHLNLNNYRNWHYQVSNNLKKAYKEIAKSKLKTHKFGLMDITFTLWKKDRRRIDRANPLSIHEKFFCDALTELGCIPDDNDEYIYSTTYLTGGIDKENPRVDIEIIDHGSVPIE